jgi:hypothetical protein
VCNKKGYVKVTGEISTESWAINSYWAEDPGKAVYPDSFIVDYVRVYEVGDYQYPAGKKDVSTNKTVRIFPNPASDQITLNWEPSQIDDPESITIISPCGMILKTIGNPQDNTIIRVNDLSPGIYFLKFRQKESSTYLKFVKS